MVEYKSLESTGISNVNVETVGTDGKYIANGKLVIIKNGRQYNINGMLDLKR